MSKSKDAIGIYKRGNVWWFSYTQGGKQYCQSTTKQNRTEAIIYRKEFLEKLNNVADKRRVGHLFAFIVNEFLNELDLKLHNGKMRSTTHNEYNYYLMRNNGILFYFKDKLINNINIQDIKDFEKYVLNQGKKEGLLIKQLKIIKSIFNFAFKR